MLSQLKSAAKAIGLKRPAGPIDAFAKPVDEVERGDDPFSKLFYNYSGERRIHKWGHFLPIYSRIFEPYKPENRQGKPVRFLEVGVWKGGSLELWRSYFGPEATIFGIDIDPRCTTFDDAKARVRIGSQNDPDFLSRVVEEMGGVDVVLDDGSHIGEHQETSFNTLFPLLPEGGLYVIEDTHTAYWRSFKGGFRKKGTIIETAKAWVDDMHGWYHGKRSPQHEIGCIQFFDSIIAIEKQKAAKPFHTKVGPE